MAHTHSRLSCELRGNIFVLAVVLVCMTIGLGTFSVFDSDFHFTPQSSSAIEELGYGSLWLARIDAADSDSAGVGA